MMNFALRSTNHRLVYVALLLWTAFYGSYSTGLIFQVFKLMYTDISTYINLVIVVLCLVQLKKLNNAVRISILMAQITAIAYGMIQNLDDFIDAITNFENPLFMVLSSIPLLFVIAIVGMNPKKIDNNKAFEDREDLLDL
ncbi:hypothetical protein [Phaeocystidibacter marisrubri]|uniref:DUF4293 family protein n=1 Tax=Phaeocystidibacter marisrubri TaxID=1577780 RepID=A0A6L3ZJU5_9FLAO|nr:hypothetical protein [Phaeocystidibacter marisrubri]KAB2817828.1 hypothetical protein F8C82_05340 [Phaeocystidibacter marisrubri]GGH73315.1 hypothetical protein GCM10011318_18220 [Phaeocystidibacter marisrubri]